MNSGMRGQVVNHKYWQTLRSVETNQRESKPSKEAIEFEKHLQMLEGENRLYEMGVAMKKASLQTNKDMICSIEALRCCEKNGRASKPVDSRWYMTKDSLVDDEEDLRNDELVARIERTPEYQPIIQKILPKEQRQSL